MKTQALDRRWASPTRVWCRLLRRAPLSATKAAARQLEGVV